MQHRALYMKMYLCFIFFGDINFPEKHCCATLSILVQLTVSSSTTKNTERIAAFPLQQQLHERTNVLSYMNTAYLVTLTEVTATHTIFTYSSWFFFFYGAATQRGSWLPHS